MLTVAWIDGLQFRLLALSPGYVQIDIGIMGDLRL